MTQPIPDPGHDVGMPAADERTWAMLGHLSGIIAAILSAGWLSFVGPLVIWAVYKDRSRFVRSSAAGAFNFNLAIWAMAIVAWILLFTIVLIPVSIILFIVALVAGVWFHVKAAISASRGEAYTYPWGIPVLS